METEGQIDPSQAAKIAAFNARLKSEQNLGLAIAAGVGSALIGALIWMGITVGFEMHLGLVAIAVGAGVGFAVRFAGKGITKIYGVIGALCTLLSCVAGETLAVIQEVAKEKETTFFTILPHVDFPALLTAIFSNASPMTYIIYGIGIYEGYQFAFRKVTLQDLQEAGLAATPPPAPTSPPPAA